MSKTKIIIGFLGNFLLGSLGVVGVGWLIIAKFPKSTTTVFIVGAILIVMCLWSAFDEMNKKLKRINKPKTSVYVKSGNIVSEEDNSEINNL